MELENAERPIARISLKVILTGKPSRGNLYTGFDVAEVGNGAMGLIKARPQAKAAVTS